MTTRQAHDEQQRLAKAERLRENVDKLKEELGELAQKYDLRETTLDHEIGQVLHTVANALDDIMEGREWNISQLSSRVSKLHGTLPH